jgi:hypothetical protein
MGRGILVVVALLATSIARAAPEDPLRDVTPAIGAAEDGTIMQVHGIIDDCLPDSCFLCPDWETASRPEQRFHRRGCRALMSWKDTNAGLLLDEMYRFSDVIVTGRFHFNRPANQDVDILCLDLRRCEQSGFENVQVDRLIERRAIERVPNSGDPIAVAVTGEDDAALRKLFLEDPDFSVVSLLDGGANDIRTYTRPQRDRGTGLEGWLCYRRAQVPVNQDDAFPWPTTYRAVELRSPANPYRCLHAWKDKGAWRIMRDILLLPVYGLD